jgi:hypothetical protein
MNIDLNKLVHIIVLTIFVLCISLISISDDFLADETNSSDDKYELDNYYFLLDQIELKLPNLYIRFLVQAPAFIDESIPSQVFHPPSIL